MTHARSFFPSIVSMVVFILSSAVNLAMAQWSSDPKTNNPVAVAPNDQENGKIASDNAGGAFIAWEDYRSGYGKIYVQRIDQYGYARWAVNGIPTDTSSSDHIGPSVVADGYGGIILVWQDNRSAGDYNIYAQKIDADGNCLWGRGGVAICTQSGVQLNPCVTTDGFGGAIVGWQDFRSGVHDHIYAQSVDQSGAVRWTANGISVSSGTLEEANPVIVSDGQDGAVLGWMDYRNNDGVYPDTSDIYAQRLSPNGYLAWGSLGVAVCTATNFQQDLAVVNDGAGGIVFSWDDYRSGSYSNIYGQRFDIAGFPDWTGNGVAVCSAGNNEALPQLDADGMGGTIITWEDDRAGAPYRQIFAQRVDISGSLRWTANGVALTTSAAGQDVPSIVSDGLGGAIVSWYDFRLDGAGDIYAQRINSSGVPQWLASGLPVSTPFGLEQMPVMTSDGSGGAIIAWLDGRNVTANDIYAQKVDNHGYLDAAPHIQEVQDVINDQGGKVSLLWNRSPLDAWPSFGIYAYEIWRGVVPSMVPPKSIIGAPRDFQGALDGGNSSSRKFVKLPRVQNSADTLYWEPVTSVGAHGLSGYSYTVPTISDSGPQGTAMYYFMVTALSSDYVSFWDSPPDSGYSVDNLPPIAPQNPAITTTGSSAYKLSWRKDRVDPDVGQYAVYRSTVPGFTISSSNRLAKTTDTSFVDSTAQVNQQYYYRITTLDIHGNESAPTSPLTLTPLAVELASFTATVQNNAVAVDWSTSSEVDNYGFFVQRRVSRAQAFSTVSPFIPGAGTSLEIHNYTWTDASVASGSYQYRLEQMDLSGNISYSSPVTVAVVLGVDEKTMPTEFGLAQNFPNPFNPTTVIRYQLPVISYVRVAVYNMLGQLVATLVDGLQEPGFRSVAFDGSNLPSGLYVYRIQAGSFSDAKKLVILK